MGMTEKRLDNKIQRRSVSRKPRLKLPYDNRRQDFGSWCYDNRRGLVVLLAMSAFLVSMFLGYKISIMSDVSTQTITVDLTELAELMEEKERLEQEIQQKMSAQDMSDVQNKISNESAVERERQIYEAQSAREMEAINAEAQRVQDRMNSNRQTYEAGQRRQNEILSESSSSSPSSDAPASDAKVKGRVTVSYEFRNPVRTAQYLDIPAYRCESGGEIVVIVTVNNNGNVLSASVDMAKSSGDDCMRQTALRAARRSRFNIDASAPEKHTGTISYIFIPQ